MLCDCYRLYRYLRRSGFTRWHSIKTAWTVARTDNGHG